MLLLLLKDILTFPGTMDEHNFIFILWRIYWQDTNFSSGTTSVFLNISLCLLKDILIVSGMTSTFSIYYFAMKDIFTFPGTTSNLELTTVGQQSVAELPTRRTKSHNVQGSQLAEVQVEEPLRPKHNRRSKYM